MNPLAGYSDAEITSEYKRRLGMRGQIARKTRKGGRPIECFCGKCRNCKLRAKRQLKKGEGK